MWIKRHNCAKKVKEAFESPTRLHMAKYANFLDKHRTLATIYTAYRG